MNSTILQSLRSALKGKKLIRVAHTLDDGLDQTVLDVPQEIWYKYPTIGEKYIKKSLEKRGIKCIRPFDDSHRDRSYTYDHLLWKVKANGHLKDMKEEPLFFCYKNSTNLNEAAKDEGFQVLMPDYKMFKDLQYKSRLSEYGVSKGAGLIPFFESPLGDLSYSQIVDRFGSPFVVQFSFDPAGWNTAGCYDTSIIDNEQEFKDLREASQAYKDPAKISKFIDGIDVALNIVNTSKGSVVSAPYLPTILKEKGKVLDHGGNYAEAKSLISEESLKQINQIARNIGNNIYKKGFKGHFGIDVLMEKKTGEIYVTEINPRFTGTTLNQSFMSSLAGKTPLIALHFAEYLDCLPESFDIEAYEQENKWLWEGGSFYVYIESGGVQQLSSAPPIGIYKINPDYSIQHLKEAYDFADLPDKDHFLVRQVHMFNRNLLPHAPGAFICIGYSREQVFDAGKGFNKKYKKAKENLFKHIKFDPPGTYDSSVPYKAI